MYVNNRTRRKWNQVVLLFLVSCHFVKYSISSPIFSSQFSQFQSARNLRNLPCVVRKSGLKGVCMFAIDCIKTNGTHLGTCIDKFYFGSCCQVKDIDSIYSPNLDDNTIDSNFPSPSSFNNKNPLNEQNPISSTTLAPSIHFSTSNYNATTSSLNPAINYNNKTFELITTLSATTRRPVTRRTTPTTEKYSFNVGAFTTTLGNILEQTSSTKFKVKDEQPSSTTESIKLTTFQSIGELIKNETFSNSSITAQKVKPTRTTVVTKKPIPDKPSVSTESPLTSATRPSRRPASTTNKPSKNSTATTVIKTTRKPVASTIAVNRRTTISRRNSTLTSTRKPSTKKPSITEEQLSTISFVQTTKVPRPKPTSSSIKVEPTTLFGDESTFSTFSVVSADEKFSSTSSSRLEIATSLPTETNAPTVKTTKATRRPITTQTSATSTQSSTLTKRPITESYITSTQASSPTISEREEVVTSSKLNLTTQQSSTSSSGLVTWTLGLGNDVTDNVTKDDTWVLITSVKPDTTLQKNTSSIIDTMLENRVTPLTKFTLTPDNVTEAVKVYEKTTKIEDTTLEMELGGNTAEISTENSIAISSEEDIDIDEETTTFKFKPTDSVVESEESEAKPINESNEEEEEEEETTSETFTEIPTTTPISQDTTQSSSSSSQMPINETMPVSTPEETTVSSLAIENSTYSSVDSDKEYVNATTVSSVPSSSTHMSLEGVDHRQICGRRMFPEARIVGGSKASFGRWPWQISLRQWRTSTYLHKCGSALLNENWAISAAHCVDNVPPSDLLLRLGEYDLSVEEEPYGYQERRVQIVASHPQFDPRTFEYDLALLRFYEPVVFQPNIIPVCVPENDEDFIGRTAYVTGWGRLYEDGPLPSVLQEVTVPVIKNDICEAMYRSAGYIEHIPHIFICAGWQKGGHDSCEGWDSGGPMVIQRTDKRFQLAGIISWGIGCAEPNQPGVYTRISEFRDWINQILMF